MFLFNNRKINLAFKFLSVIIIQALIVLECGWAWPSNDIVPEQGTENVNYLAPELTINTQGLQVVIKNLLTQKIETLTADGNDTPTKKDAKAGPSSRMGSTIVSIFVGGFTFLLSKVALGAEFILDSAGNVTKVIVENKDTLGQITIAYCKKIGVTIDKLWGIDGKVFELFSRGGSYESMNVTKVGETFNFSNVPNAMHTVTDIAANVNLFPSNSITNVEDLTRTGQTMIEKNINLIPDPTTLFTQPVNINTPTETITTAAQHIATVDPVINFMHQALSSLSNPAVLVPLSLIAFFVVYKALQPYQTPTLKKSKNTPSEDQEPSIDEEDKLAATTVAQDAAQTTALQPVSPAPAALEAPAAKITAASTADSPVEQTAGTAEEFLNSIAMILKNGLAWEDSNNSAPMPQNSFAVADNEQATVVTALQMANDEARFIDAYDLLNNVGTQLNNSGSRITDNYKMLMAAMILANNVQHHTPLDNKIIDSILSDFSFSQNSLENIRNGFYELRDFLTGSVETSVNKGAIEGTLLAVDSTGIAEDTADKDTTRKGISTKPAANIAPVSPADKTISATNAAAVIGNIIPVTGNASLQLSANPGVPALPVPEFKGYKLTQKSANSLISELKAFSQISDLKEIEAAKKSVLDLLPDLALQGNNGNTLKSNPKNLAAVNRDVTTFINNVAANLHMAQNEVMFKNTQRNSARRKLTDNLIELFHQLSSNENIAPDNVLTQAQKVINEAFGQKIITAAEKDSLQKFFEQEFARKKEEHRIQAEKYQQTDFNALQALITTARSSFDIETIELLINANGFNDNQKVELSRLVEQRKVAVSIIEKAASKRTRKQQKADIVKAIERIGALTSLDALEKEALKTKLMIESSGIDQESRIPLTSSLNSAYDSRKISIQNGTANYQPKASEPLATLADVMPDELKAMSTAGKMQVFINQAI
ncbi:MAG: hypothetical protein KKD05_00270 [Candidatus Omnitrophica bacterium]|nr:hypothetical protein [Candidatus Omnitrophota bacterium]